MFYVCHLDTAHYKLHITHHKNTMADSRKQCLIDSIKTNNVANAELCFKMIASDVVNQSRDERDEFVKEILILCATSSTDILTIAMNFL